MTLTAEICFSNLDDMFCLSGQMRSCVVNQQQVVLPSRVIGLWDRMSEIEPDDILGPITGTAAMTIIAPVPPPTPPTSAEYAFSLACDIADTVAILPRHQRRDVMVRLREILDDRLRENERPPTEAALSDRRYCPG